MSSVSFPVTFTALTVAHASAPLAPTSVTVSSLASDELLIRLSYASINAMDPKVQQSNLFQQPLPFKVGYDWSGTVAAVGGEGAAAAEGKELRVGDEAFGYTLYEGGCFAEYVVVKRQWAERRGGIPAREAGAYGIAYPTAYDPLVTVGQVQRFAGQWAFVPGGAGGVGHFGVQICLAYGLKVISSAGKAASLALLRSMGVQHIVDYSAQDVVQEVLRLTGGRGADFVFDSTLLPSSFVQSASCVASGGVFVKLGLWEHSGGKGKECQAIAEQRGATFLIGNHAGTENGCLLKAVEWFEQGKVRPHISSEVKWEAEELQKAIDAVGAGTLNVGKVVVNIRG